MICIHKLGHFVTWLHRLNSFNNLPPKAILLEYLKKISHGIVKGYILLLAWSNFAGVVLEGVVRCWFVMENSHRSLQVFSQVLGFDLQK